MTDNRQYAPATQRNRQVILEVLLQVLPPEGNILEIASGTGEHSIFFAPHLQPRQWIPSDPSPLAIASITDWQKYSPAPNLTQPLTIDVTLPNWSSHDGLQNQYLRAIVNINMIHISPWAACLGLIAGTRKLLPVGGVLYLYGPFRQDGSHTAPSNAEFDANLRSQNPEWGIRDLEAVIAAAEQEEIILQKIVPMPANNLSVVFQVAR